MWDSINKVAIRHIIAVLVVVLSFGLVFLLCLKEVPPRNEKLVDILIGAVIGSSLTAVIGWLFTTNKHDKSSS